MTQQDKRGIQDKKIKHTWQIACRLWQCACCNETTDEPWVKFPLFPLEHYYSLKCLEKKHVCNTLMTLSGLLFQAVGWKEKIVLQMTSFYLSSNNFNQPFPHLGLIFAQGAQNYHLLSRWILNRLLQVHCQWNFWVKSPDNTPSTSSMIQPPPFPTGPLGEKKKRKKNQEASVELSGLWKATDLVGPYEVLIIINISWALLY